MLKSSLDHGPCITATTHSILRLLINGASFLLLWQSLSENFDGCLFVNRNTTYSLVLYLPH